MSGHPPHSQRRWFRFGLRTMLVLTVLISVPLAWKFNSLRAQRRVVQAVLDARGAVKYDYEVVFTSPGEVHFDRDGYHYRPSSPTPQGPGWLRRLLGDDFFAEVTAIILIGGDAQRNDELLALLPALSQVRIVDVRGVTDEGLAHLVAASTVRKAELYGTFTDAGVHRLAQSTRLKHLSLKSEFVTDAALVSLRQLSTLEGLEIKSTCDVSRQEIERLRWALPNCAIMHWEQGSMYPRRLETSSSSSQ